MIRREYTVRTIEHAIDAPPHTGARIHDVDNLVVAAMRDYRQVHGIPDDEPIPDDVLALYAGDDELVVRYTTPQEPQR